MPPPSRRRFLQQGGAALAGSALAALPVSVRAAAAPQRLTLGLIGPGGMGMHHLRWFAAQKDVALTWVCDPDETRRTQAAAEAEKLSGLRPRAVADLRTVLADPAVDGVIIATPDHWHAPATLLACAAGKHVYVEKPCSHNIREGRLMIEAARRHRRVVQVGTQSRSTEHVRQAMERLQAGAIGDILVAKAWNSQRRSSIGREQPGPPPPGFDHDLWLGPAPWVPFQKNRQHSWWRWWHDFGTGDMGNDGVHDLDIARWGLGMERHPDTVTATGGKYFFEDDQEFPDTMYVSFDYLPGNGNRRRRQLIYEHRTWSPYVQEGFENGNAFYGTDGMLVLGKSGGWKLYGPRNTLREEQSGRPDTAAHQRNFLDCLRSGRSPNAPIEAGHLSATLCHLGNIAVRTGRPLRFAPKEERILGDRKAAALTGRRYRPGHWATPTG